MRNELCSFCDHLKENNPCTLVVLPKRCFDPYSSPFRPREGASLGEILRLIPNRHFWVTVLHLDPDSDEVIKLLAGFKRRQQIPA